MKPISRTAWVRDTENPCSIQVSSSGHPCGQLQSGHSHGFVMWANLFNLIRIGLLSLANIGSWLIHIGKDVKRIHLMTKSTGNVLTHKYSERRIPVQTRWVQIHNSQQMPWLCGSVDWAPACEPKGRQFDSQSGHVPGLWSRSPIGGIREATTLLMFLSLPSPF